MKKLIVVSLMVALVGFLSSGTSLAEKKVRDQDGLKQKKPSLEELRKRKKQELEKIKQQKKEAVDQFHDKDDKAEVDVK